MKKIHALICLSLIASATFTACSDKDDNEILPINNKCLKRTQGPNLVGNDIYFVYAMAMPYGSGQLQTCTVEASIAGAEETWLEHNSYHTNSSGFDVAVPAPPSHSTPTPARPPCATTTASPKKRAART